MASVSPDLWLLSQSHCVTWTTVCWKVLINAHELAFVFFFRSPDLCQKTLSFTDELISLFTVVWLSAATQ